MCTLYTDVLEKIKSCSVVLVFVVLPKKGKGLRAYSSAKKGKGLRAYSSVCAHRRKKRQGFAGIFHGTLPKKGGLHTKKRQGFAGIFY